MHRSFQSAMTLFQPQLVIFLGDLFDEGQWVTDTEWKEYVLRFHKLFHTPDHVKVVAVVGNHDIGFHYVAHPKIVERFDLEFHTTGVDLFSIEGVHFVAINSVAMQGDGCHLCDKAEEELKNISSEMIDAHRSYKGTIPYPHITFQEYLNVHGESEGTANRF